MALVMVKPLAVVGFVVVTLFCAAELCIATTPLAQAKGAKQLAGLRKELEDLRLKQDSEALFIIIDVASFLEGFEKYHERIQRDTKARGAWTMEEINNTPITDRKTTSADMTATLKDIAELVESGDFRKTVLDNTVSVIAAAMIHPAADKRALLHVVECMKDLSPPLPKILSDLRDEDKIEELTEHLRKSKESIKAALDQSIQKQARGAA